MISAVVLHGGRWCRWSADHRHRTISAPLFVAAAVTMVALSAAALASCGADDHAAVPAAVQRLVDDRPSPTEDIVEVWICDVPVDTTDTRFVGTGPRLALDPTEVTDQVGARITEYFASISHGQYSVRFAPGGTVTMTPEETAERCVESALDRSSPTATVVLAIATAEQVESEAGGWGRPGTWFECADDCSARATRRAAYIGASDFHPRWGPVPLLDLIEHELGHTIGLPHSGVDPRNGAYLGALDVMSNSAAPRELHSAKGSPVAAGAAAAPVRLDGPDTIAVNRLDLGWLTLADVAVVAGTGTTSGDHAERDRIEVVLHPSTGADGLRLAIIELDEHRLLTVELLTPTGFDDHLDHAGVAVHIIDDSPGVREVRVQQPVGTEPPHLDLLQVGDVVEIEGWAVSVIAMNGVNGAAVVHLAERPADR